MLRRRTDVLTDAAHAVELPEDFVSFWRREWRPVVTLAAALTGDWASAEDLAQDAFVSAHRSWDRIENPAAWVRRVVSNAAVSRWRRRGRESRALARLAAEREPVTLAPDDMSFWDAVRALPPRQAQVVALFYLDDLAISDIALILEIAQGTVKATLAHARAALAETLGCAPEEDV